MASMEGGTIMARYGTLTLASKPYVNCSRSIIWEYVADKPSKNETVLERINVDSQRFVPRNNERLAVFSD